MKAARKINVPRIAISFIAMFAWFVVSNHCALGLMAAPKAVAAVGHEHCPGHAAPAKGQDKGEQTPCCLVLKVPPLIQGKSLVNFDANVFALQLYFVMALILPDNAGSGLTPQEIDTGPPRVISFAETVLQRSLLAHAPPSFA